MPASLRALLTRLIDYAGLYPPAALPLSEAAENYERYLHSSESWILNRLVLAGAKLGEVELGHHWRVTLLVDEEPGTLPKQVETFETKGAHRLSLPTYCEVPIDQVSSGGFAKLRTGGLTPDAIPPSDEIADFLCAAVARRTPFKATAGLHHPIRSERPLTYAADSPRAVMHGFVNVFLAASFAWHGMDGAALTDLLNETDPESFRFLDGAVRWRGQTLSTAQVAGARREFAHSFGSCSFEEPVTDLRQLGWLP